ncbi:hypothetical protein L198_02876 [Cryptococcus wingfieldii CBS 7118]|uniref:Uncharacterized protein n=1 Tax=Cryptococcus wingfieldii CBS 7118 TaxID=1295528 RepID=A0A1E3JKB0_9TREE|nr:hypothetical protein L198_02876 [Cryptococcus wingfieldii CBS 7118]ODO00557.1 hypothetical protein L198_02876 [Cryptococcus wingfieldii CBS 7118]
MKSETSLVLDPEPEPQANGKDKGVEELRPQKTRHQKNLSALQFPTHNPSSTPLTSPLLLLHTALTTRKGLVRDLEELRVDLEEDAVAWAGLVNGLTGKVNVGDDGDREADGYNNIQTLASLLPPLLQSLSAHLQSSSSSLLPLIPFLSPPSPSSPSKPKLISVTEEQAGEGYYAKLFLEKMNLKMGKKAGHVWDGGGVEGEGWRRVREGEGEKWVGMKEFSEKVFLISHTALQNLPLLPYPPRSPLPYLPIAPSPTVAPNATSPRQIRFSPPPFSYPNSPPPSSSSSPFPTSSPPPHPLFSPPPAISTALRGLALQARLIIAKRRADNLSAGGRGYWELKLGDELEGMYVLGGVQRPLGEGDYVDFTLPSPQAEGGGGEGEGDGDGDGVEVRVVGGIRVRGSVPEPENAEAAEPLHIFPGGDMQEKERGHKRSASLFSRVLSLRGRERTVSMQGRGKTSPERVGGEGAGEVMELKRLRKKSM